MPLSATVCVPSPPPALTLNVAAATPVVVGENDTLIVQLPPTAMEVPQVLVLENNVWFAPVRVMLVMGTAAAPVFVTVTTVGAAHVVP